MIVNQVDIKNIDTAMNGFDGFNLVMSKQYDLIICDLNMPVMDGFECA
jgi:YesN/AraC family two-component response regulator